MSGQGNFSAIGGGLPPALPPASSVDGTKGVGAPASSPPPSAAAPSASAREAADGSSARSIAQRLDSLLLQAARTTTQTVEAQAVQDAVAGLELSEADRQTIARVVANAQRAMADVSRFTGREIGEAIVLGEAHVQDQQGGRMEWDATSDVGKAMKRAIQAQGDLSEVLHALLTHPKLNGDRYDRIQDMALRCDRRGCEIVTLATELARAVGGAQWEVAGDQSPPPDPRIAGCLDQRLDEMLPAQEVAMHGTEAALEKLKDEFLPLVTQLEAFAARPNVSLGSPELLAYTSAVERAATALNAAAKIGLPSPDGKEHILLDKDLLSAAGKLVAEVRQKLADVRNLVGRPMLRRFAEDVIGLPKDLPLVSEVELSRNAMAMPTLVSAARLRYSLRNTLLTWLDDPSAENLGQLSEYLNAYVRINLDNLRREVQMVRTAGRLRLPEDVWAHLNAAFPSVEGMHTQVAHFLRMAKLVKKDLAPEQFLSASSARALMEGRLEFPTLVEARVHGMSDADVNPALDDSHLAGEQSLGSGRINAVTLVQYKDGSEYVFKPEAPGRQEMESVALAMDYEPDEQIAQLNLATQDVACALGLEDVVTHCSVGVHRGQYGLFMEKAPGLEADLFAQGDSVPPGSLSLEQVKALKPADYAKVVGDILRGLNRLEWLDLLTGQGDRHAHNYMIDVRDDLTVTVKGIDNDACFPGFRTGLRTYVLKDMALFEAAIEETAKAYPEDRREEIKSRMKNDPGVRLTTGGWVLDTTKFKVGELHYAVMRATGVHGATLPGYIDEALCEKLLALDGEGPARKAYREALSKRLPPAAVEAAESRLDEAIALAEKLQDDEKVISAKAFAQQSVQRSLVQGELWASEAVQVIDDEVIPRGHPIDIAIRRQTRSLFARDILIALQKGKWFSG